MEFDINGSWKKTQVQRKKQYQHWLKTVNKTPIYKQLPKLHEEAFNQINCLACAACCKNYSPRFKTTDIKRISKTLKLKESVFIDTYLNLDTEGDYVTKTQPCPFLGDDNFCSIYEDRPSDCKRFPYTDEDVLLKREQLTLKNSSFCPAVFFILEKLVPERK